jgi:hypothetical protein
MIPDGDANLSVAIGLLNTRLQRDTLVISVQSVIPLYITISVSFYLKQCPPTPYLMLCIRFFRCLATELNYLSSPPSKNILQFPHPPPPFLHHLPFLHNLLPFFPNLFNPFTST